MSRERQIDVIVTYNTRDGSAQSKVVLIAGETPMVNVKLAAGDALVTQHDITNVEITAIRLYTGTRK